MPELPETRESLLLRVRDPGDAEAWDQFAAIYRPAVYRLARRRGLQHADAEDIAQRVLVSVSAAIGDWNKDASRGTFRAWLLTVARNRIINLLTRRRPDQAAGGTSANLRLSEEPETDDACLSMIEEEHRRALFRWAAEDVRNEFEEQTWLAFQRTAVEGLPVEKAAAELGKSVGAVYAARSRIMRRLKRKVSELETEGR